MKKMINVEEDKKNNKLIVTASAPKDVRRKIAITTLDVENYLKDNDYKYTKCLKEDSVYNRNNKFDGHWEFEIKTLNIKKIPTKPNKTTNSLDKTSPTVLSSIRAKEKSSKVDE
tara:strand:+ start:742 stop:1083 length:342 start_codon:yes stop_codon:yes gene_type:complete